MSKRIAVVDPDDDGKKESFFTDEEAIKLLNAVRKSKNLSRKDREALDSLYMQHAAAAVANDLADLFMPFMEESKMAEAFFNGFRQHIKKIHAEKKKK
jgi:hypothetical protein